MSSPLNNADQPVIRVELKGGPGNQLFQAAAAYALALRLHGRLQLDVTRYRRGAMRSYGLDAFNHGGEEISAPPNILRRLARRIVKTLPGGRELAPPDWQGDVFTERYQSYDERINSISNDCYLRGYFQSYRYFLGVEEKLRAAFEPSKGASDAAKNFARKLGSDVIALHVRAGDFLSDSKANAVHGTLPQEYYTHSLAIAREARPSAHVLAFSDNMDYAASILPHDNITFVRGFSAHDDLYLMSCASSHIIANSTFSYFSAWLDASANPLIIAPKAWMSSKELEKKNIQDLYPPGWILV